MRMRMVRRFLGLGALIAATASCGDVIRQDRSPVILIMNSLQAAQGNKPTQFFSGLTSDVITNVTTPAPCTTTVPCPTVFNDVGQAVLSLALKDIGSPSSPTVPTTNNVVTINRYHVSYRRADGRNTPGVDVPYPFDGASTATVGISGSTTIGLELVRIVAKQESPLVQLITNPAFITTIADVTFYGHDLVGNEVSVTGSIQVTFGNFGDF
jgi:hypothetical protein